MKNKNAFTLIELLAIIVILAIIAVITVPIILNIIENSRRGAVQDSAYGYKDAINKMYVSKLTENPDYSIPNNSYNMSQLKDMGVTVSGQEPDSNSWVQIENNKVLTGCLQFDEYKVNITEGKVRNAEKGRCKVKINIPYSFTRTINGTKYASASDIKANPILYNPVTAEECTYEEYNSNISSAMEGNYYPTTGCLKWYAYSYSDEKVNMILSHNTTAEITWCSWADNIEGAGSNVGITYPQNYTFGYKKAEQYAGPISLLKKLKEDTTQWANELIRNDSYSVNTENSENKNVSYTIDYSGYKARLISFEEITAITNSNTTNLLSNTEQSGFYVDTGNATRPSFNEGETSDYSWLFDYECFGTCTSNTARSYWTVSPATSNQERAWLIDDTGHVWSSYVNNYYYGVRPVITVPASEVMNP